MRPMNAVRVDANQTSVDEPSPETSTEKENAVVIMGSLPDVLTKTLKCFNTIAAVVQDPHQYHQYQHHQREHQHYHRHHQHHHFQAIN